MLSFEEFFQKKKIDLFALRNADESLYNEFKAHYVAMGEKSFDHSKKFWFNKLRKTYLLSEVETAKVQANIAKPANSENAPNVVDSESKKLTNLGFKPKFKAANKETLDTKEESISNAEAAKPTGFKPRFKTKDSTSTFENTQNADSSPEDIKKPTGFKPRFKAGVTKSSPKDNNS